MFQRFVNTLDQDTSCNFLKFYLRRHIQVDGEEHGPLSEKLMNELAAKEDPTYQLILAGALNAI
jgi:hypothetical protein